MHHPTDNRRVQKPGDLRFTALPYAASTFRLLINGPHMAGRGSNVGVSPVLTVDANILSGKDRNERIVHEVGAFARREIAGSGIGRQNRGTAEQHGLGWPATKSFGAVQ